MVVVAAVFVYAAWILVPAWASCITTQPTSPALPAPVVNLNPAPSGGQAGQLPGVPQPVLDPTARPSDGGGVYQWPANRINPEVNPIRQGAEGNWEDAVDGQWLMPDGTTFVGVRPVDANGQKYGIWLQEGPHRLTGPDVLQKLVPNADDRKWVIRVSPEGPRSGGWWTVEVLKPGASESMVPGLLVPAGGKLITFSTTAGGRFDYWRGKGGKGGFAAPAPAGQCVDVASQDADSALDNWQIGCPQGSTATFRSDGVSWYPKFDGYFVP